MRATTNGVSHSEKVTVRRGRRLQSGPSHDDPRGAARGAPSMTTAPGWCRPVRAEDEYRTEHDFGVDYPHSSRARGEIEHSVNPSPRPGLDDASDIVND